LDRGFRAFEGDLVAVFFVAVVGSAISGSLASVTGYDASPWKLAA
jgi:hypothetical protein